MTIFGKAADVFVPGRKVYADFIPAD